jgi:hypothetical protein
METKYYVPSAVFERRKIVSDDSLGPKLSLVIFQLASCYVRTWEMVIDDNEQTTPGEVYDTWDPKQTKINFNKYIAH